MSISFKNFLLFFILSFPLALFAQKAQIRGVVVDAETKAPIVGASVALLSQRTNAYIRGGQTGENGSFRITDLDINTYALQVTYVGYKEYIRPNIVLTAGQQVNLGNIAIAEDDNIIDEVVVEGRRPELEIGIDRKVFDVSQSMVSVGGTAQDLLANVPTLQVNQDGEVSLRGSGSVRIFIDGKESSMAGSDINSLLQSLPAEVIDKVELITNPSARYDAEGESGIINIVLKKNARIGFNGSVNVSGGSYENAMAGITLNFRNRKFNHFGNYNFNRRVQVGDGYADNIRYVDGEITRYSQRTYNESESRRRGHNHTLRLGTDYYLSDKTTLSLLGNLSLRDNDRRQEFQYWYTNVPGHGTGGERTAQQYEDDLGLDLQFDFRQELKREGEELTGNFSFGYDTEDGTNDFDQTFQGSRPDFYRYNETTERGRNYNVQLDYTLPLGDNHRFETGYRSILRYSEDTQFSSFSNDGSGNLIPDYNVSNEFELENKVHALYVNYQRQLTSRIGAQLGVRAEKMDLVSRYYDVDPGTDPAGRLTTGGVDYFRLFPSAYLTYGLGDGNDKIQLSYSRRVQRPRGWHVNPFLNVSDESNIRQGNPNLLPADIHIAELGYAKFYEKWNFVTSLFYRRINDRAFPVYYDPAEIADVIQDDIGNVTYARWENVSEVSAAGVELISKVNLTGWWDVTGNVNVFYSSDRMKPEFDLPDVSNFMWDGNLTTNIRLPKGFSAQVRGDYRSGREIAQGRMKSMWAADVAVRKDFMNRRANLMVNARDIFNSRMFERETFMPENQMAMGMRRNRRLIMVTFTYNFGVQDLFGKKQDRRQPSEVVDEGVEF